MIGSRRFILTPGTWYGWQMLPGYGGGAYFSPIRLHKFAVSDKRPGGYELEFYNAGYAQGVRDFRLKLISAFWSDDFLAGAIDKRGKKPERLAIVTPISVTWIETHCRDWVGIENLRPDEDIGAQLDDLCGYQGAQSEEDEETV